MSLLLKRQKFIEILFFIIIIFSVTFLRKTLIFVYPVIVVLLMWVFKLKLTTKQIAYFSLLLTLTIISSAIEGFFLANFILSIYLIFPVFILLTSKVKPRPIQAENNYFEIFFKQLSVVLVFINISALVYSQILIDTGDNFEDSFTGLYGSSGFGAHTLSIINLLVGAYYFYKKEYFKFLFFLVCGILGFYGLGIIVFLVAFFLVFLSNIIKFWKTIFIVFIIGITALYSLYLFNPTNFRYIEKNINYAKISIDEYDYDYQMEKAKEMQITRVPRFITFLYGAQKLFFNNPKVFFLGTSPGGYNSRTAFYFNGDFMTNKFIKNTFKNRTVYHESDVLPLLNRKYIERPYNDGTRNQPFSSILSMLLEYGVFIGGIFLLWFFLKIKSIRKKVSENNKLKSDYLKFLGFFIFLLFLVQNYLEYPEIILPAIIIIKLAEIDLYNNVS